MRWQSALAVFFLFWVAAAFVLLPFGVKTDEEVGAARIAGQAESAPHRFDVRRHLLRSTVLAIAAFGLFYANYVNGWITPEMLDFYH
jgi:predicted secreted protein